MPDLDTPRVFIGLYRIYRSYGHRRRASLALAWKTFRHRLY